MLFPVVIHKDPTSNYSVTIPDMPGCFTAGKSIEEAVSHIQDATECHYSGEPDLPRKTTKHSRLTEKIIAVVCHVFIP